MLADLCDPSIPVESNSAHYVSPAHFGLNTKSLGYVKPDATATTLPMPQNSNILIQPTANQ